MEESEKEQAVKEGEETEEGETSEIIEPVEEVTEEKAEMPEEEEAKEGEVEGEIEAEERIKPPPREEIEEEFVEERIYTIPLSKAWIAPPRKRAPRAIRIIKAFITKHMKLEVRGEEEEESRRLVIANEVNERIWRRGIKKPPRKIRVRAAKDRDGNVTVFLAEGD